MKKALRLTAITATLFLSACGGGGSSSGPGYAPIPAPADPVSQPAPPTQPTPPAAPAPNGAPTFNVILYGDSIMAGNGTNETPAMTLQRLRPNLTVTDRAVAGTSLATLATGWGTSDRAANRVVVIENGAIDSWQGMRLETFLTTMRALVFSVRAEGRIPVFTGYSRQVPGILSWDQIASRDIFNASLYNLAGELAVPFADWGAVEFNGSIDLMDGVHPGKTYSDRLVQRLAETLDGVKP
ncbi:SGNH/GDSL hydrolase family protein [Variovorax paradoxus]|nr:SGNH/GDSL hydrolase family protein [Variovorax paradoxus]